MSDRGTSDSDRKTAGLVHVHTEIGNREGVIVELRPEGSDYPSERDMTHLSDKKALELYNELGEYLNESDNQGDRNAQEPGWATLLEDGRIQCARCGAISEGLPIDHERPCIYNNSLVA